MWNRFAFVHFKNADVCRKAHDKADGLKIRGRTIMVVYARKKADQPPSSSQTQQIKGKYIIVDFSTSVDVSDILPVLLLSACFHGPVFRDVTRVGFKYC